MYFLKESHHKEHYSFKTKTNKESNFSIEKAKNKETTGTFKK